VRVLHVSHTWTEGGSGLYAAALSDEQVRLGADARRFGPATPTSGFRGTWSNGKAEAEFRAAVGGADIVHVHHLTGMSLAMVPLARRLGARVVVTLHDFWMACARGQLVDVAGRRCPGPEERRCAACLAPALWAPIPAGVAARLPLRTAGVRERAVAVDVAFGAANLVLSPSAHLAGRLGVRAERTELPLLRHLVPAPDPGPGPVRFLFLGSLLPTKGPLVVIEAFAGLPAGAASLTVAGPAPSYNGTSSYADATSRRAREVPGVRLLGAVPPTAVQRLLDDADVLLFPSTWDENSPLVLREATAAGLRVLASDVPGVAELVPEAARVEPGDVVAWRRALATECRRGRGRAPPRRWPTMAEHAADLLGRYAGLG
jgi:glycosyltransferase involved in cell wall biosynthesis